MAKTVNESFDYFLKNVVNLDKDVVSAAKRSRDNLFGNIADLYQDDFFTLWNDINLNFGSFARKTKCRELDDIDLMVGISADGATYNSRCRWDDIVMFPSNTNKTQMECVSEDGTLNSTKVLNKFKSKLEELHDYSRSDIHKNGEAVTLNLKSRDWSFDIVPCFHTTKESDGRDYYLIPNGKGNWKKTDPRIDRDCLAYVNQKKGGFLLDLIRLCKKWNKVKNIKTIPSYLLETMLINYAAQENSLNEYIDIRFLEALKFMSTRIFQDVEDLKGIQGNINLLSYEEKRAFSDKAKNDYQKGVNAYNAETKENNHNKAIKLWKEIFGEDFPDYE